VDLSSTTDALTDQRGHHPKAKFATSREFRLEWGDRAGIGELTMTSIGKMEEMRKMISAFGSYRFSARDRLPAMDSR
jgi:hypothetical protein